MSRASKVYLLLAAFCSLGFAVSVYAGMTWHAYGEAAGALAWIALAWRRRGGPA